MLFRSINKNAWDKIHLGGYLFCANQLCVLESLVCFLLLQESLDELGVDTTCFADLTPYIGINLAASRTTLFEGGGDDEDIPTLTTVAAARAKPFLPKVNSILVEPDICYGRDFILPKSLHDYIFRFANIFPLCHKPPFPFGLT